MNQRIEEVAQDNSPVLATGRIAAHLVGNADVETVGQYLQRREQLAELDDRKGMPIRHYRWILLDSTENFQQSPNETTQVEAEALEAGFSVIAEATSLRLLQRKD